MTNRYKSKKVVIAAVSARAYVHAAQQAGYEVIALDAFADVDMAQVAMRSYQLSYSHGRFDKHDFERVLSELDFTDVQAVVYGSGFEAAPELIEQLALKAPVLGNTPQVLRQLKTARDFFEMLDALNIAHPEVSFKALQQAEGWLMKRGGGSGGTHIADASLNAPPPEGFYYQCKQAGEPVSVLFVADGKTIQVIGFNRQYLASTSNMPYRYGGATSRVDLPNQVQLCLKRAAELITQQLGLRGLNSLDAMMLRDESWVLEVNPRLSASFDLYALENSNLFEVHLQACRGVLSDKPLAVKAISRAHRVVYADKATIVKQDISWPDWAADIPIAGSRIAINEPICSVYADASDAEQAEALLVVRVVTIINIINHNN